MKKENSIFPYNDLKWKEALDFILKVSKKDDFILAPIEFSAVDDRFNHQLVIANIGSSDIKLFVSFCVIHKGRIDYIGNDIVKYIMQNGIYIYGNEVFVIFSLRGAIDHKLKKERDVHHKAFINNVRKHNSLKRVKKIREFICKQGEIIKVAILSARNMGNVGDDLVSKMAERIFQDAAKKENVEIKIKHMSPPVREHDIDETQIVCLGGGGLIYDIDFNNVINYMEPLSYAQKKGALTAALGIGVQGVRSSLGREVYLKVLNNCNCITVRDPYDYNILTKYIGINDSIVFQSVDLAFYLYKIIKNKEIDKSISNKIKMNGIIKRNGKKIAFLSLTDTRRIPESTIYDTYESNIGPILKYLLKRGYDPYFIVHSNDDLGLYRDIIKDKKDIRIINLNDYKIEQIIKIYDFADIVICTRYHALILSIITGRNIIVTGSHNNKQQRIINNYINELNKTFIPITEFSVTEVKDKLDLIEHGEISYGTEEIEKYIDIHLEMARELIRSLNPCKIQASRR